MAAGRQRTFDKEEALTQAMEVFWQKGFSGASLSDLTGAMGINKPSLYAAFGNKEQLFVSAINKYVAIHGIPHFDKLLKNGASLKDRLKAYLRSIVLTVSDPTLPSGCFVANGTTEVDSDYLPDDALQTILEINKSSTGAFTDFFKEEQEKGNLEPETNPKVLADYLLTTQFGLALMARNRISRSRLNQVIDQAITNF